jgi:hypothetical protein
MYRDYIASMTMIDPLKTESELLYEWRFTANQYVLATHPLRLTTRDFLQLNSCAHSPYVSSILSKKRMSFKD